MLFVKRADEVMAELTHLYQTVYQTIIKLKEKDLALGIVSGKFRYRIEGILEREKLLNYFDVIIGGEDTSRHKPDPEGLIMACKRLNINPQNVLYIGDTIIDAQTARNAMTQFTAVLPGVTERSEFESFECNRIVESLSEVSDLLSY